MGENCDLQFKIGTFRVSECLNQTNRVFNVSEFEIQSERICNEMHCYRGERIVNQSYCAIELGVPYVVYQANYAGNMTWQQGYDYCLSKNSKLRHGFELFLTDFNKPYDPLRRFERPAYIDLEDVEDEGTWIGPSNLFESDKLIWDTDPNFQNSDDRDYGVVKGSLFQAYSAADTGPDVLCVKNVASWKNFRDN